MWKEVRAEAFDEYERCYTVDAWNTFDPSEEGQVVAKIYLNGVTVYLDERAKSNRLAQEAIADRIGLILNEKTKS